MNLILKGYWSNNPISVDEVVQNPEVVLRVPVGMVTLSADVDKVYVDEQDSLLSNEFTTALQTLDDKKANATAVTQSLSTKADLVNGVIPASQLPSFVDDVLEYDSWNQFPSVGEAGKIYVDTTENKTWRWSGSTYVIIGGGGVALGETAATAYRGDRGKAAYDHSISQGNPHNATTSDIPEGDKLYFTQDRVLQAALIGLNTTNPAPVTATDALLAAIGKLQAQINAVGSGGSSGGVTWVNAASIGTVHSAIPPANNFIELARIDGMLWLRGSFKNTGSIIYESKPYLLRIDNINYKVIHRNSTPTKLNTIVCANTTNTQTTLTLNAAYTICVDEASAATCTQYIVVIGTTLMPSNTFYHIPPTCLGELVIK